MCLKYKRYIDKVKKGTYELSDCCVLIILTIAIDLDGALLVALPYHNLSCKKKYEAHSEMRN